MRGLSAIVVMGVSGCGKSTVAARLAQRLGWDLAEADTFHGAANVEKMTAGIPLGDEDRWPWLDAMARYLEDARVRRRPCVIACSALKRRYRERLTGDRDDVGLVYLQGSYETILSRLAGRTGHYMPPSLLRSQFDALEEPGPDEHPISVSVEREPGEIVEGKVLIELKAVQQIVALHEAQILTYMKLSGLRVGLLLNFNVDRLKSGIHRFAR